MTNKEISEQLLKIVSRDDFASSSATLTEAWSAAGVGVESIDPILEFMEAHPDQDYGMPGALVHFVEEFDDKDYVGRLIKSISRKPTMLTVWMLNRVINGTREPARKEARISAMRLAATNPKADIQTLEEINHFLKPLNS
jgi:hypothetical protein